jgi:Holliday junction DNA helicase RuvA
MIAKLSGLLDSVGEGWAIVDVGGVGYIVQASTKTLSTLPPPGKPVRLHVETQVRDEKPVLFAFAEAGERDWFRTLLTVQGVGPKVALAILSVLDAAGLARAVAAGDKAAVARASGVGPKLAQRVCAELKDKIVGGIEVGALPAAAGETGGPEADAVSALVNLGYGRSEAFAAVTGAARTLGGRGTAAE